MFRVQLGEKRDVTVSQRTKVAREFPLKLEIPSLRTTITEIFRVTRAGISPQQIPAEADLDSADDLWKIFDRCPEVVPLNFPSLKMRFSSVRWVWFSRARSERTSVLIIGQIDLNVCSST